MSNQIQFIPSKQVADGVKVEFSANFNIIEESDVQVFFENASGVQTELILTTNYTVDFSPVTTGFSITTVSIYDNGYIILSRQRPLEQPVETTTSKGFAADVIERQIADNLSMQIQQIAYEGDRAVKTPIGSGLNITIPIPEKGKTLVGNATGGFDNSEINVDDMAIYLDDAETEASNAAQSASDAAGQVILATVQAGLAEGSALSADSSADRAEASAASLESILPESGDEGKFLQVETPFTAGYKKLSPQNLANLIFTLGGSTRNSVNSAKVNTGGYADFIAKVSDTSVVHYAGGSNPNIVETDVLGRTHTITADETVTGMTNNGVYEMLKEYDLATGVALASAPVAVNTTNLKTLGVAVSGGDYAAGYPKEYAFDGSLATAWASSQIATAVNGVSYIGRTFGGNIINNITAIDFTQAGVNKIASVKLQSYNGSTWADVQTFNSLVDTYNLLTLTTPLNNSQGVRLLANSSAPTSTAWSVYDFNFYGFNTVKEVQVLDTATFYDGDYRTVTGVQPNRQYKKAGGVTTETTFIRRGQATKTAGTMGTPVSYSFNLGKNLYVSPQVQPVLNTPTIINHNLNLPGESLARARNTAKVNLVCVIAEQGYSVGDYAINACGTNATFAWGFVPTLTSSSIQVNTHPTNISGAIKTTGVLASFTTANWRYELSFQY